MKKPLRGRPPFPEGKKKVHVDVTLDPELAAKLKEEAPNGGKSKLVEKILKKGLLM